MEPEIDLEEDDYEDDEEEFDPENESFICIKWLVDGASTLLEVSRMLRMAADDMEKLDREGWVLESEIDGGHGSIHKKAS
jgi:hypothetical protein